jgi:hypothetical protein
MTLTKKQLAADAAWKQVFRSLSYLVATYGHAEDDAIALLNGTIQAIRKDMQCAS